MSRLLLPQLCNDTNQPVTEFSRSGSHYSKEASFLPKHLCLPFYKTPVNHISFGSCIKMAEQVVQVCLKKQLKELSLYCQLLRSSNLLTWDKPAARQPLVPFASVSNPIWAGQSGKGNTTESPFMIFFYFFGGNIFISESWGCTPCPAFLKCWPNQRLKRARGEWFKSLPLHQLLWSCDNFSGEDMVHV